MITLYLNWNAVCAQKVMLCLAEKGLAADIHHIDLGRFEQHDPAYLALNANGVVPTLVHDGFVVTESTVINEYLDDAFPRPALRPATATSRADMRIWGKLVDDVLHVSLRPISFTRFATTLAASMSPDERDAMRRRTPKRDIAELWTRVAESPFTEAELAYFLRKVEDVLDRMEAVLTRQPWLTGDGFSLADINITPYFRRLEQLEATALWTASRPQVQDWLKRVQARPSYGIFDELRARYAA